MSNKNRTKALTQNEFRLFTEGLASEVQSAAIDYQMYEDLAKAADNHPDVIIQSRAFWDMTIWSHLNSSILHLCRIYDSHSSVVSLPNWLRLLGSVPESYVREKVNLSDLERSRNEISEANIDVKKLVQYRHTAVAHLGESYVFGKTNSLHVTFGQVKTLIRKAHDTFNHYSGMCLGKTWSSEMIGADDFQFIFRVIQEAVDRSKKGV